MPPLSAEIWRAIAAAQRIDRTCRSADQIALGHRSLPPPDTPNRQKQARFPMMFHFCAPLDEAVPDHAKGSLTSNR